MGVKAGTVVLFAVVLWGGGGCGLGLDEDVASDSKDLVRARVVDANGKVLAEGCDFLAFRAAFQRDRRLLVVPLVRDQELSASFRFESVSKRNEDLPDNGYEGRPASFWCGPEDDNGRGRYRTGGFGCLSSSTNPGVAEVIEIRSDAASDHLASEFSVRLRVAGPGVVTVKGGPGCSGEGEEFALLTIE